MLNNIQIMGRLTREPEMRKTQGGTSITSFTVACDRDFGEKETDFIDCVAWRQTGEFISKYFRKGFLIILSGSLHSHKWEDKNGNKRVSWVVTVDHAYFGESKGKTEEPKLPEEPPKLTELPDDGELPF